MYPWYRWHLRYCTGHGKIDWKLFYLSSFLNPLSLSKVKTNANGSFREHLITCLTELWCLVPVKVFTFGSVIKHTTFVFLCIPSQSSMLGHVSLFALKMLVLPSALYLTPIFFQSGVSPRLSHLFIYFTYLYIPHLLYVSSAGGFSIGD